MLAPNTFAPDDSWLSPVLDALIDITRQVSGIGKTYKEPPEGDVEDNSVLYPLKSWKVETSTYGKAKLRLTFNILHLFRRDNLNDDIDRAFLYVKPWLQALSALGNTDLNGLAITTDPTDGQLVTYVHGNMAYIAIQNTVEVLTEFTLIR